MRRISSSFASSFLLIRSCHARFCSLYSRMDCRKRSLLKFIVDMVVSFLFSISLCKVTIIYWIIQFSCNFVDAILNLRCLFGGDTSAGKESGDGKGAEKQGDSFGAVFVTK